MTLRSLRTRGACLQSPTSHAESCLALSAAQVPSYPLVHDAARSKMPADWSGRSRLFVSRRIELAPEVFRLLFSATDRSAGGVCELLERFCVSSSISKDTRGTNSRWSALGDIRVSDTGEGSELPVPCRQVGELTLAPAVRGTVIDGYRFHAAIFGYQP